MLRSNHKHSLFKLEQYTIILCFVINGDLAYEVFLNATRLRTVAIKQRAGAQPYERNDQRVGLEIQLGNLRNTGRFTLLHVPGLIWKDGTK